jgi:hypothetical protein
MKKVIVLFSAILLILTGCTKEKPNSLEGAWDMIYTAKTANDTIWSTAAKPDNPQLKMYSKEHFIFVGTFKDDTVTMDNYGGGTYKLDGNICRETIEYHVTPEAIGKTIQMYVEVSNDTLYQIWPADDQGQYDKSNYREERYTRLK